MKTQDSDSDFEIVQHKIPETRREQNQSREERQNKEEVEREEHDEDKVEKRRQRPVRDRRQPKEGPQQGARQVPGRGKEGEQLQLKWQLQVGSRLRKE